MKSLLRENPETVITLYLKGVKCKENERFPEKYLFLYQFFK